MSDTGTYVYCLVVAPRRPALRGAPRGLPRTGAVRLLPVESARGPKRWLVVANAPLAHFSERAVNDRLQDLDWVTRAAVAHERVIEAFSRAAAAILPMKLFTIFLSDARALQHIGADRAGIDAVIKRVTGQQEWGVRVTLDRKRVQVAKPQDAPGRASAGARYLTRKKADRDRQTELVRHARAVVATMYDRLAGLSSRARRRPATELPLDGPLLLDAAYLVPRNRVRRFRAAVEREARALGPQGYYVTMSGPWPPYSFLEE
jgi:hypothetical protein